MVHLILVGLAVILGYIFATIVYRLFFHPLADYPGPLLAKATDWYIVYHTARGDNHINFHLLHQKYGDFVRFGPNRLAINSNTAFKEIYSHRANVQKSPIYGVFARFMGASNVHLSIDKTQHARKRRVMAPAFSDNVLKSMEDPILQVIDNFCGKMIDRADTNLVDQGWSSPRNIADFCDYLAFDIMGTLCFGKSFDMLDIKDNRYILDTLREATSGLHTVSHMPFLMTLRVHKILFGRLERSMIRMKAYCADRTKERINCQSDDKSPDFFTFLLQAKDQETGQGFTYEELTAETGLLLIAGSDTTAVAMSSALFYLLHNPSRMERLNSEIRSRFASIQDVRSGARLSSCEYLRACVDEAMRFSPPGGGILPRQVLKGGITIHGHHLPQGIDIGTPHYALHHNEKYFPDSFRYLPERWLAQPSGANAAAKVEISKSAFCAFSSGPRGCLGKNLAYQEILTTIARLIWLYDLRLQPGSTLGEGGGDLPEGRRRSDEYQLFDTFASKAHGPMVQFRPRSFEN